MSVDVAAALAARPLELKLDFITLISAVSDTGKGANYRSDYKNEDSEPEYRAEDEATGYPV
jgi:hypothetical protein